MKLIALSGLAGCGKSTAAKFLEEEFGYARIRFAGPLKRMLRTLGLTDEEIEGALKEKPCALLEGKTPRHAMITLGTEWGRDLIGGDFWVKLWRREALAELNADGPVVVEDCRFLNEASMIWGLGGTVMRIERPGLTGGSGRHISESLPFASDSLLINTGDERFLHRVAELVRRHKQ